jgi:hypothetical protein
MAGLGAAYLGFQFAGVAGAFGGAVVTFFLGKSLERDARAGQKATIASAEEVLKSAEETAKKVGDRGHLRTRRAAVARARLRQMAGQILSKLAGQSSGKPASQADVRWTG